MLIFQTGLDPLAIMVSEIIITNTDIRNNVFNFSVKIPFEEANSRCVACAESIKGRYYMYKKKTKFSMCPLNLKHNFETNQNSSVLMRKKLKRATPSLHLHWSYKKN